MNKQATKEAQKEDSNEQKKEDQVEFSIRVPKSLNIKLQDEADLSQRSRNKQVIVILEDRYNSRQTQKETKSENAG